MSDTPTNPPLLTDPIIGIDLGTTNSLVAHLGPAGLRVIPDSRGRPLLPSVVRYSNSGAPEAVGYEARDHAVEFPQTTINSAKRLMGRSLADAAPDLPYLGFQIVQGPAETARIRLPSGKTITPQEVSAVILRALRDQASASLGVPVTRAVVTVPAYFDDAQRQATRDAGRLAGLDILRIINEPTAAALAYGIGVGTTKAETIAVFDLGGGTFDISILAVIPRENTAAADFFQVLATAGDTHLGGDDIDQLLVQLLQRELISNANHPPDFSPASLQRLRLLAESLKVRLSAEESVEAVIDLGAADSPPLRRTITRPEFDALIEPWLGRALRRCARALRDAKLSPSDIHRVVMVGGSTRIPLVRQRAADFFLSDPYTALDPDQVVALGAAVQAAVLAGANRSTLLLDVIPLSLGVETVGGAVAKLIMRNTQIPARATDTFTTSADNQTSIKLHILQGEREMAADCRSLGLFHLRGLPPMPAGIPQLLVEFLIDESGVLVVSAHEKRSGKHAALQVLPSHGLSPEEVERLEAEAFTNARDDMTRHRIADLIANSRLDLKWTTDALARVEPDLDPDYLTTLRGRMNTLADLITQAEQNWRGVEPDAFHKAKEALDHASIPMHEACIKRSLRGP